MAKRINIDSAFADCVERIGGRVLDREHPPPSFKNADFVFENDGVVAELKTLEEDLL